MKMNKNHISSFITSLSVRTMPFHSIAGTVGLSIYFRLHCGCLCPIFTDFQQFLFYIQPQQCKFYVSVMKSNLPDVRRLLLSSFMA